VDAAAEPPLGPIQPVPDRAGRLREHREVQDGIRQGPDGGLVVVIGNPGQRIKKRRPELAALFWRVALNDRIVLTSELSLTDDLLLVSSHNSGRLLHPRNDTGQLDRSVY